MTTDIKQVENFIDTQSRDLMAMQVLEYRGRITTQSALIQGQRLIIYAMVAIVFLTVLVTAIDTYRAKAIDVQAVQHCLASSGSETMAAWTVDGCRVIEGGK